MRVMQSYVKNKEGYCTPIWLSTDNWLNRINGGQTGVFIQVIRYKICGIPLWWVKVGEEFRGVIKYGSVYPTKVKRK